MDGWDWTSVQTLSKLSMKLWTQHNKQSFWNGPMGVFELEKFAAGTEVEANKLAELSEKGVTTFIGGDSVEKVGVAGVMSHISTGGGASLELLEGKVLSRYDRP